MTTEERMNIIKAKAKAIANAELDAKAREDAERQELINKVKELAERIQSILSLANACRENGLKMPKDGKRYGYEHSFVAEEFYHHTGLIGISGEYKYLGIKNGGACGPLDFWTDGNTCTSVHKGKHKPVSFFYTYVDRNGRHCYESTDGFDGNTKWKPENNKQYFFGCWWNEADEKAFVDNWDQDEFERKFAAEVERVITEKANKANAEYEYVTHNTELLRR